MTIVETAEQEKRLKQARKIVQRRNLERGIVGKKRAKTRNAAAEPAAELDGAAAPPMAPWVPDEARTCYRCHQVGHIGRNCPTVLNAAAVGAVPRRVNP